MRNDIAFEFETPGSSDTHPKRILLIDSRPAGRQDLADLLVVADDLTVCGEIESGPKAIREIHRLRPDLVVLDIGFPGFEGLGVLPSMLAERPDLPVVVLSLRNDAVYAIRALRAGAKGFITKDEPRANLVEALRKVLSGGFYLNPTLAQRLVLNAIRSPHGKITSSPVEMLSSRELEILRCLGNRYGSREIAENLDLSIKTVETHRANIREKLGLSDGEVVVRFALEWVTLKEHCMDEPTHRSARLAK